MTSVPPDRPTGLNPPELNRRSLCKLLAAAAGTAALAPQAMAEGFTPPTVVDVGKVENGSVTFPPWRGPADTPSSQPASPLPPEQRVGFAIVGLGRLSLEEILPAFGESLYAKPVALVSGTPDKLKAVATQYGIKREACYSYEDSSGSPTIRTSRWCTSSCPMPCTASSASGRRPQASMC